MKESDFKSESDLKYYQVVEDFKDNFKKYIDVESQDNEYFLECESNTREQVIKRIKEMCDEYKGPLFNQFQEQRLRNEMESNLIVCYQELFSKAKVFLDRKTEEKKLSEDKNPKPFTRKEIETAFDEEVWNEIINKFRSCLNKNEVNENPRQDALNTIQDYFRVSTTLFNDLLKKKWPQKEVIGYDFLKLDNCKGFFDTTGWFDYRSEDNCKEVIKDHQAREEQFNCILMEFLTTTKYDSSVFIKAVKKIQTICQMPKDGKFYYLPNYQLYLSVIFCNNIFHKLEALVFEESQKRDPLVILEREYKKKLIDKLEMMYKDMSQVEQCSDLISGIIEDKMTQYLSNTSKNNKAYKAIAERVKFTYTKRSLLREIQSEIIKKKDWYLAKAYITDFKEGVEVFIGNQVDIELTNDYMTGILMQWTNQTYAQISDFVAKLDNYKNLKSWLSDFRNVIGGEGQIIPLRISEKEFGLIDNLEFNDKLTKDKDGKELLVLDTMKIELKKSLDQKLNLNKASKHNLTVQKYFKPCDRLEIRDSLVKSVVGCTALCPFCKAPCELTIPNHKECHSTNYHRLPALFGDTLSLSGQLFVNMNCNGLILSDFQVDDPEILKGNPKFFYKSYKSKFPEWDIAPDHTISQPAFWKLFIFIFQGELKKQFNQKDVLKGSPGISGYSLDISQWGNSDIVEATKKHLESYGI